MRLIVKYLLVICSLLTNLLMAESFQPVGRSCWDMWFAKDDDSYHMFFLEAPAYLQQQVHGNSMVGHAVSKDLVNWVYQGPALTSTKQSWNNHSIATGSVAKFNGQWYMMFTGWSSDDKQSGLGLAVSDDLSLWVKNEEGAAVKSKHVFESDYKGRVCKWIAHRDPYIYPEKIGDWYYAVVCSLVKDVEAERGGSLAMIRSRDMVSWEPYKIVAFPGYLEWMETPQLWKHKDRWYMYFGAVRSDRLLQQGESDLPDALRQYRLNNCYFVSDSFEGPFEPLNKDNFVLSLPSERRSYIFKFLDDSDGNDVAITCINFAITTPYSVSYDTVGAIKLDVYR